MSIDYDLVIVGGGMVGTSLALALADSGLRIAVIESVARDQHSQPSYDDRGIALSLSSQRIFDAIGVWPKLAEVANPIKKVHVSDKGHFGKVRMDAASLRLDALGYVVIARELGSVLLSSLDKFENIDLMCPAKLLEFANTNKEVSLSIESEGEHSDLSCRLLIAADGTHSGLRAQLGIQASEIDYQQTAIVSNVTAELSHENTAFERFTEQGPLAVLPLAEKRAVVVQTVAAADAEYFLGLNDESYLEEIINRFGRRLGTLQRTGKRRAYSIVQVQADQQIAERAVLLGNAAHTIHPNGAQGFNLCLRDVAGLAEHIKQACESEMDIGSQVVLDAYLSSRKADQDKVSRLTHSMSNWFYNRSLAKTILRNTAMTALDIFAPAKTHLIRRGMGLSGRQPAAVRQSLS